MENKWYKKVWAKYLLGLAVIGALSTGGSFLVSGVNWWNTQNDLPADIKSIDDKMNSIMSSDSTMKESFDMRILTIEAWINNKKTSRAVGFRMKLVVDEDTEIERWEKQYRDWSGMWHKVYLDPDLSELYGVDHYYYIDEETHRRVYCW